MGVALLAVNKCFKTEKPYCLYKTDLYLICASGKLETVLGE